jgi:translation initiation factor eIF-2B subunit delta
MATPINPLVPSSTSESAATAPAQQQSTSEMQAQQQQPPREPKGAAKSASKSASNPAKQSQKPKEGASSADGATPADAGSEKLTPAELKKKAKAEKAARRAKERAEREQAGGAAPAQGATSQFAKKGQAGAGGAGGAGGKDTAAAQSQKGRGYLPRRGSAQAAGSVEQKKKQEDKSVAVFGHLYGQQRRTTVAGAGKEVHPAVLALGLQMRDYVICGSSARCVATLLAFKRVCFLSLSLSSLLITLMCFSPQGDRVLHNASWYLLGSSLDYPPLPPDHLSLHLSPSLDQSGKRHSCAQAGYFLD